MIGCGLAAGSNGLAVGSDGFAAGCEARLCLAVIGLIELGAMPLIGFRPETEPGRSPVSILT